jgi:type IV fimbrial biogenesis protein FimT
MAMTLRRPLRGFTLPEAMISILVLCTLGMLAMPMLGNMVMNHRIRSAAFELLSTLNYARSEAIKRNNSVTVAALGPGWESGWRVIEPGGSVMKLRPQLTGGVRIAGPGSVVYERDGRLPQVGVDAAFDVNVDPAHAGVEARCVRIDLSGRVTSRRGTC